MKKRVSLLTVLAIMVFAVGVYLHGQDSADQVVKKARFFNLLAVQAQDITGVEVSPTDSPEATPVPEVFKPLKVKKGSIDYFLRVDGIQGESTSKKHPNEIEIDSYSWGLANTGASSSGGGGGAGKAVFDEFLITTLLSKATPTLFQYVATGKHIKEVTLTLNNNRTGQDFYKIKLSDVLISSYHEATNGELLPAVQFGIRYSKIELSYYPQKADGSLGAAITAGYDIQSNKAL